MQKNKSLFFGVLCGIILSIISVNINLNKFDVIDQNSHLMISGDINLIWKEAEQFKLDILNENLIYEEKWVDNCLNLRYDNEIFIISEKTS